MIDNPLIVDPQLDALVGLGDLGVKGVFLRARGLDEAAPQDAESVGDRDVGVARRVPDVQVNLRDPAFVCLLLQFQVAEVLDIKPIPRCCLHRDLEVARLRGAEGDGEAPEVRGRRCPDVAGTNIVLLLLRAGEAHHKVVGADGAQVEEGILGLDGKSRCVARGGNGEGLATAVRRS